MRGSIGRGLLIVDGGSGPMGFVFFFLNEPPPTEISPLPLHAALPISKNNRGDPAYVIREDGTRLALRGEFHLIDAWLDGSPPVKILALKLQATMVDDTTGGVLEELR